MVAYLYRMPAGIPGNVTRAEQSTIEAQVYDPAAAFPAYGVAAKIGANTKMQPIGAGDTAAIVYGLLVRPYPTTAGASNSLGSVAPSTTGICNIMRRGYMMVLLGGTAAAVKGGQVYVRVGAAAAGKPLGGFEAAADGTNTVAPAGLIFTGPADAQGNTEIAFNI